MTPHSNNTPLDAHLKVVLSTSATRQLMAVLAEEDTPYYLSMGGSNRHGYVLHLEYNNAHADYWHSIIVSLCKEHPL